MNGVSVKDVEASGASPQTARQDNLQCYGVAASEAMAQTDYNRMLAYKNIIEDVGRSRGVEPALIAAIISRESRAGNALVNGYGDGGRAFGLMQVDITPTGGRHVPRGTWNSREHIDQGTEILLYFMGRMNQVPRFSNWTNKQKLKGAVAAYNMGDGNVYTYGEVDENTTGKDYSNDVIARAKWYKNKGFN